MAAVHGDGPALGLRALWWLLLLVLLLVELVEVLLVLLLVLLVMMLLRVISMRLRRLPALAAPNDDRAFLGWIMVTGAAAALSSSLLLLLEDVLDGTPEASSAASWDSSCLRRTMAASRAR